MASRRGRTDSDPIRCSVCLKAFIDLISIPCGHIFCKTCFTQAWNSAPYRCPECKEVFNPNTSIKETVRRESTQQISNTVLMALVLVLILILMGVCGSLNSHKSELQRVTEDVEQLSAKLEFHKLKQFAVDLTLDPDTAHPTLVLFGDLKQVIQTDVWKNLPHSSLRFDTYVGVLSKQRFSTGRFYFEVQVKGKTVWDFGVVQECIDRKGSNTYSPQNGYWVIMLRNKDEYTAGSDPPVRLYPRRPPQRVAVFVDYSEGTVSFYDADSEDHLFSFTRYTFRGRLLIYLNPGLNRGGANSSPLVFTPV